MVKKVVGVQPFGNVFEYLPSTTTELRQLPYQDTANRHIESCGF